ncbi:MAG TPA: hypothetical protein VMU69_03125 [Bradyrhizobium sp.]|nr:hypothetical protein [Bradyrhizobium sp.]
MGNVIGFIPKSELERIRLIQEARAIYDGIFPPTDVVREEANGDQAQQMPAGSQVRDLLNKLRRR